MRLLPGLAAAVVLAGCGGAGAPDLPPGPGRPVAAASPGPRPSPLTASPGPAATALERVAYQLEADVLRTARVAGPTRTACDAPLDEDGPVSCTVAYAGLSVPYTVTVSAGGTPAAGFRIETDRGVLVREALLRSVGSSPSYPGWLDPRCAEVPPAQVVPIGRPSGVTCTYRRRSDPEVLVTADVVLERYDVTLRPR